MKSITLFPVLAAVALAAPAPNKIEARSTSVCGQWDTVETGSYTVYQDLWGEDNADSGSQCTTVTADDPLAWSTSWTWSGGSSDVKSYANAIADLGTYQVSAISSIATTWDWSYDGTDVVADVAYDIFTSSTSDGDSEYEIMVWLAALGGAGPISSTGSTVATPEIGGVTFDLYSGANGDTTVYSFVAESEQTAFSGDLMDFFSYLVDNEGYSSSQYVTSIGAGTEAFTGTDAVFTVTSYSISMGDSAGTSDTSSSAVSSAVVATSVAATSVATSSVVIATSAAATSAAVTPATSSVVSEPSPTSVAAFTSAVASSVARPGPTGTSTPGGRPGGGFGGLRGGQQHGGHF